MTALFVYISLLASSACPKTRGPATNLDYIGNETLTMTPVYELSADQQCGLSLEFARCQDGKVVSKLTFYAGESFGIPNSLVAFNFLGNRRKQVFVSLRYGAVRSFLLDYDGSQLRTLYKRIEGRVMVLPSFDSRGRAILIENWPKREFLEEFHRAGKPYTAGPLLGMVRRDVAIQKESLNSASRERTRN